MDLTNEDVADILALLDSLPYDELDLRTSRFRLTLRRSPRGWTQERLDTADPDIIDLPPPASDAPADPAAPHVPAGSLNQGAGDDGADSGGADTDDAGTAGGLIDVTAPLPGTFYRSPRPGAAPFTEAGEHVEPDTVVAIVETMKLMNPVHAGARGTVAQILAANAEAVTHGAVLLRITPDRP